MAEKSFARQIMQASDVPKGMTSERQHTGRSYSLRVKSKDGRTADGFPWALFNGYRWNDNGKAETLVILFSNRAITITGEHLLRLADELDDEQLKGVQEHNPVEAELLRAENRNAKTGELQPIILSVSAEPRFEELVNQLTKPTQGDPYGPEDIGFPERR